MDDALAVIPVPLGTDFEIDLDVAALNQATRAPAALVGETLTFWLSATASGGAIHADLSLTLTDLGDGRYYGFIPGASMTARLAAYAGQQVYPRLYCAEAVLDGVFRGGRYLVTQVAEIVP